MNSQDNLSQKLPVIADYFSLGPILKSKRIEEGVNGNFAVRTSRGKFFVKIILEPHTATNKVGEVIYITHLAKHGIPVIPYLPDLKGSYIFQDGETMAMVQDFVSGSNPEINLDSVTQIGRALGRLHSVPFESMPYRCGWISPEYVAKNLGKIINGFRHDPGAQRVISAYESSRDSLKNILPSLPKAIIHADAHSYNVIFRKGELIAFVDWEDSTIAPALFDFVSTAAYWCWDLEDSKMRPKLYRTFYESYTKERRLTDLEIQHLEDCMRFVAVLQTMWSFLNFGNEKEYDALWRLKLFDWKAPNLI